ncbi:MAG: inorganic phosphate transporter, PiT family [Chloroflexota bacterium]|jgi:PiT family inorganic phosphate transporter|nr:inorganic phosphate transporter, PiT family [Chloroflexota bacterium]
MDANVVILLAVVLFGLTFDFTNGFHDTANAMATSIATGALSPRVAVALSGALNFAGAFLGLSVAATIATGIVDPRVVTTTTVFAGLIGAITWNLLTWLLGLPSSSSHAIVGGTVGATLVQAGPGAVNVQGILSKVLIPAMASPIIAVIGAAIAIWLAVRITRRSHQDVLDHGYRVGQILSASMVSLAHGTNDAQKTMGIITLALITTGSLGAHAGTPRWVVVACAAAIALGTYTGGWRVIRTLGKGITDISPQQGFSAESISSSVILGASNLGFAVSTTQVTSGSVLGVGLGKGAAVRWAIAAQMVAAWIVTVPVAAAFGGAANAIARAVGGVPGVVVTALVALAVFAGIWHTARRQPINAGNVNAPIPAGARSALALDREGAAVAAA